MADLKKIMILERLAPLILINQLEELCREQCTNLTVVKPKLSDGHIHKFTEIKNFVQNGVIKDLSVKIVFFTMPLEGFEYFELAQEIRKSRKDIFLVCFDFITGRTPQQQYLSGLAQLKNVGCNLFFSFKSGVANNSMVITPEEAVYHESENLTEALTGLVEMAKLRSHLTFTRSTVVSGESIDWNSDLVPSSLRAVVNHCIKSNAYKPFQGVTVGHFAVKINDTTFLTSKRKTNFNDLDKVGLVRVVTDGPDSVIAYGSKPSVGGQSQRIVFGDHKEYDCIVHFHSPLRPMSCRLDYIPIVSQREIECGSHECGKNTSKGLKQFGNLSAVMLARHGPNIVFNRSIDPLEVINFIDHHFDLGEKTGGYQL